MEEEVAKPPAGAPKWMVTFADLSTLLLCFFVLLLSYAEIDVAKFKRLAGQMRQAFGVQAEVEANQIPKGTSIVAREFQPGKPEPTTIKQVRQITTDSNRSSLRLSDREDGEKVEGKEQTLEELARQDAQRISEALAEEIEQGKVEVRAQGTRTVIHILEKGSFDLGSADMKPEFLPVLEKIHDLIVTTEGVVRIGGHTDSLPIATQRFRSNWELSAARAVTVLHEMLDYQEVDPSRFLVAGYADTKPIAANDEADSRAKNRRVDISILRGEQQEGAPLTAPVEMPGQGRGAPSGDSVIEVIEFASS